jgi:capsular polysaccharide biosynthesis protein
VADHPETESSPTFFSTLWRHKLLIIVGTLVGLGLGLGAALAQPTIYTAESRVFLSSQSGFDALSDGPFSSDPSRYLDQQAAILTSSPLLTRALALGASAADVEELKDSLDVIASAESDVLTVRATADEPTAAASRVDATIASYREYQKAQVAAQLAAIGSLSSSDERRAANQRAAVFGDGVELVEQASVTSSTSAVRNGTVLAVVGALVSSGIGFASSARGNRRQQRSTPTASGVDSAEAWPPALDPAAPEPAARPAAGLPVGSRTP